jgi:hypothetical protein
MCSIHIHLGVHINAFMYTNETEMVDPPPDMPTKGELFVKLIQLLLDLRHQLPPQVV